MTQTEARSLHQAVLNPFCFVREDGMRMLCAARDGDAVMTYACDWNAVIGAVSLVFRP